MKRSCCILAIFLILAVMAVPYGMASDQEVDVYVPAAAFLWITVPNVAFDYPGIDTWTADTNTQTSNNFYVISYINTDRNPDMLISSSALQRNGGGDTIPLGGFRVYATPQWGSMIMRVLDQPAVIPNIGAGLKFTQIRYSLTIGAGQQAGTYSGTVMYSLVNT